MATIALPDTKFTWTGYSRAGEATSFVIPERRWMFDCGGCATTTTHHHHHHVWKPLCIFLTHTHADHIHALTEILFTKAAAAAAKAANTSMTQVYFPAAAETTLRQYLQAFYQLIQDDDNDDEGDREEIDIELQYGFQLRPLKFNQEITLPKAKSGEDFILRTVECCHRKVCLGYSIFQRRMVLKQEYRTIPGPELGKLAKAGAQLKERGPLEPVICFLGDTTATVFQRHAEILQQHTAIAVECTFWEAEDVPRAAQTKHMHWNDLRPVVDGHPRTLFLLQHFSLKHGTLQWMNRMRDYNSQSGHFNVHPMLPQMEVQSAHDKQPTNPRTSDSNFAPTCNCFVCCPPGA